MKSKPMTKLTEPNQNVEFECSNKSLGMGTYNSHLQWKSVLAIPLDHPVVFLQIQPLSAIFTFAAVKQR